MNPFLPDEVEVLRALARAWPGAPMVVLGATALRCAMPMPWRATEDIDLAISVSVEDATSVLSRLPGWSPDPRQEQRWHTPDGISVDVVPAGPGALARGWVRWPRTGFRMSLLGMRLAFEHSVPLRIDSDQEARIAPLHVLTVLKMVAFLERPDAREKDVGDLAHIMHGYVGADSDRRFSAEVPDDVTEFEDVAPFLLGRDVSEVVNPEERRRVSDFLATVEDDSRGPGLVARMSILGPAAWRNPDTVLERIRAFRRGMEER